MQNMILGNHEEFFQLLLWAYLKKSRKNENPEAKIKIDAQKWNEIKLRQRKPINANQISIISLT